ncbi:putative very-long-chain acyl-CoA synthetase [Acinetobacter calcoaceticus]|uniref:long-chain-acyl-CoA synthetase n=1 Tax=Acinetobacter calcoaceticus TaxID=471 RepID=UPI000583B8B5|nr:long-chain-acyl-CoA synthetase [Acinetobacter calcoaceticus]GAM30565.1 putative very-long-chain acyl-CoA synthetase [Acinetobacter calcoaceticus]
MNKQDGTFSLLDIVQAGLRLLPYLPKMIRNNYLLNKVGTKDRLSTGYILEMTSSRYPENKFLIFEDKHWSYQEFNMWVNRIAHLLKKQGVRAGDCVALMFSNSPELLACLFAVNKIGAIAGMLNHHQNGKALEHSLGLIKPRLVIVGSDCLDGMSSARTVLDKDVLLYCYGDEGNLFGYLNIAVEIEGQPSKNLLETAQITLGKKCFYIFTSGTTGLPKAATMTHHRWYRAGLGMGLTAMRLTSKDIMYCPLPLYHNNALTVALSSVLNSGATLAISRQFSVSRFWTDIRFYNATSFIYIGEMCRYLLQAKECSNDKKNRIRVIIGNGMRAEIWEKFQKRFDIKHICEFYGASENSTAFINILNLKRTAGFCPMEYAIVKFNIENEVPISDYNGFMQKVRRGGNGLLLTEVNHKIPFDGYSERKATQSKLFRNVFKKGDCWFNTGDIVQDQGFRHISFVDRIGDTYRWKGENVATTEVESVIQNFPNVQEAIVYGVQVPHTDGRAGMVAITPIEDQIVDLSQIYTYLVSKLPGYAIPLFIRLREKCETTSTFKIKRKELQQEAFYSQSNDEQIYVLHDRNFGYTPLNGEILQKIESGQIRF